jgi:hypothetical protein
MRGKDKNNESDDHKWVIGQRGSNNNKQISHELVCLWCVMILDFNKASWRMLARYICWYLLCRMMYCSVYSNSFVKCFFKVLIDATTCSPPIDTPDDRKLYVLINTNTATDSFLESSCTRQIWGQNQKRTLFISFQMELRSPNWVRKKSWQSVATLLFSGPGMWGWLLFTFQRHRDNGGMENYWWLLLLLH